MHELGLLPGPRHLEVRRYRRRNDEEIPSARRPGHLSHPRPHGRAVVDARAADRGQGQLRLRRRRRPRRHAYTEARLTHLGAILMEDIDKDTVDFVPNYDEKNMEPVVLPAAFPNLLVNGGTGIAVGMATNSRRTISRSHRRHLRADRQARHHHRAVDEEAHQGPRFPHRLHAHRHGGHQELFRDRPRQRQGPRASSTPRPPRAARNRSSSRRFRST
jgi:hypothetical protein